MEQKQFGARLRQARRSAGLSRAQTVKLLGWEPCTKAVLAAFEVGGLTPSAFQLDTLCNLYHIQEGWLRAQPLRFATIQDAFAAERSLLITDDQLMQWLLIDRSLALTAGLS